MKKIEFSLNTQQKNIFILGTTILFSLIFLWTRLWKIEDGLFFLNDMGRDFLVLLDWAKTGKPPLLGPQNSVLPFNQSALYFYWLMPIYLLSGKSMYASVFTLIATSLGLLWLGMIKLRKHPWWPQFLLGLSWLIIWNPASIEQNRFVWNPSFVSGFLAFTLIAIWQWLNTKNRWWLIGAGIGTGISLAFSFSLAPVFIALALILLIWKQWRIWSLALSMFFGTIFANLPTLAFEARHGFVLTQAVLRWIQGGAVPDGTGTTFTPAQKMHDFLLHTLGTTNPIWQQLIIAAFLLSTLLYLLSLWRNQRNTGENSPQPQIFLFAFTSFWLTLAITFILPIGVHAHYIFGLATLAAFTILTLPNWGKIPLLFLLTILWWQPTILSRQFARAPRTVSEMQTCAARACSQTTEPIFASIESGILPFHNGPDWRYALATNGCDVRTLELEPNAAQIMFVVSEFSDYVHYETKYHELTLFGQEDPLVNIKETEIVECTPDIRVHILKKTPIDATPEETPPAPQAAEV